MSHARSPLEREAELYALLKNRTVATSTPKGSAASKAGQAYNEGLAAKYYQHSTPKGTSSQKPVERPKYAEIPTSIFHNSPRYAGLNGLPPKFQFLDEKRSSVDRPSTSKPGPSRPNAISIANEAAALASAYNLRASPKVNGKSSPGIYHVENGAKHAKSKERTKDSFDVSHSQDGRKVLPASAVAKGKGTPGPSEEKVAKKSGYLTAGIATTTMKVSGIRDDGKRPASAVAGSPMTASLTKILGQVQKGTTKGGRSEEQSGNEDESTLHKLLAKKVNNFVNESGQEKSSMYSTVGARTQTNGSKAYSKVETPKNGANRVGVTSSAKKKSPTKPQKLQISIETGEISYPVDQTVDRRPNETPSNDASRQTKATPKGGLGSFITKVNKGDVFSVNLNLNSGNGKVENRDGDRSLSKKTKAVEEKPLTRTPKSGNAPPVAALYGKYPKTTTNQETKAFVFNAAANRTNGTPSQTESKGAKFAKPPTPTAKFVAKVEASAPSVEKVEYYMTYLERYNRNPRDGDYFNQLYREHFVQTFQAMTFCKMLRPVDPRVLQAKRVVLPKREGYKDKKTLVFDLDETLIHCNESTDIPSDAIVPIKFPHGEIIEAGINIRPYAVEMLAELCKSFEIIVFTASHGCYANVVLDYLDPTGEMIHHRLFRENCVQTEEGIYIKDLRVLANRDFKDMVIVDNAAYSFGYQIENGIPCVPFYENKHDNELKHLTEYLRQLVSVRDVREVNRRAFRLNLYQECESQERVLDELFSR